MHRLIIIDWLGWLVPFLLAAAGFYWMNLHTRSRIPGIICVGLIGGVVVFTGIAFSGL